MKLNNAEFKRFKELSSLAKSGKLSDKEQLELSTLAAKKAAGGNDVKWWNKYPMIQDAANFPFNFVKGQSISMPHPSIGNLTPQYSQLVNGVKIAYFRASGKCDSSEDPLNYQMRQLWLAMHRKYRGMGSYEWADLGIAMKAIVEAFTDVARAERIYGAISYFTARNRSIPHQLLQALDFDESVVTGDHLADFRYQINRIIAKAKSLCLPKGLGILQSYLELESNVFCDSDSVRASWYVYTSPYYAIYDPATVSTGGCVVYRKRTANGTGSTQTFDDIISDLEEQFNILLSDTDIARICSDVIACYGEASGVVTLNELPEGYIVKPLRDDTRLLQLHNSSLVGYVSGVVETSVYNAVNTAYSNTHEAVLTMYQKNGIIYQELIATGSTYQGVGSFGSNTHGYALTASKTAAINNFLLLDIWKDDVNNDDKIEMTRQTVYKERQSDTIGITQGDWFSLTYGSILPMDLVFFNSSAAGFVNVVAYHGDAWDMYSMSGSHRFIAYLDQIDWHPCVAIFDSQNPGYLNEIVFDVDNFVECSKTTLARLHDACMLSGWKLDVAPSVDGSK